MADTFAQATLHLLRGETLTSTTLAVSRPQSGDEVKLITPEGFILPSVAPGESLLYWVEVDETADFSLNPGDFFLTPGDSPTPRWLPLDLDGDETYTHSLGLSITSKASGATGGLRRVLNSALLSGFLDGEDDAVPHVKGSALIWKKLSDAPGGSPLPTINSLDLLSIKQAAIYQVNTELPPRLAYRDASGTLWTKMLHPDGAESPDSGGNSKGDKGDQGIPGTAATIQIGTVTTGAPGSAASVTNSGTSTAAVWDIVLPRGADGQPGSGGATAPATTPELMVFSDSIGNGYVAGGGHVTTWPQVTAQLRNWVLTNRSIDGSSMSIGGGTPIVGRLGTDVLPASYTGHAALMGLTNDWDNNLPLGTPGSTDTGTLYGSTLVSARIILNRNALITLHLCTPLRRAEEGQRKGQGYTVEQARQVVRDVARQVAREFPGRVQLVDFGRDLYDAFAPNSTNMEPAGLHPTAPGYTFLGQWAAMQFSGSDGAVAPPTLLYSRTFSELNAGSLGGQDGWTVASGSYAVSGSGLAINAAFDSVPVGAQHALGAGTRARVRVTGGAPMLRSRMQGDGRYYAVWALYDPDRGAAFLDFGLLNGGQLVEDWGVTGGDTVPRTPLPAYPFWMELAHADAAVEVRVWAEGAARPSAATLTHTPGVRLAGGVVGLAHTNQPASVTRLEIE